MPTMRPSCSITAIGAEMPIAARPALSSVSIAGKRYEWPRSQSAAAAQLGHRLFFDKRLSLNGQVACATCHNPALEFQDGIPLGKGVGTTDRRTMPVAGTAYSPYLFWDGRKDSQWAQALGPLESAVEHGGTREQYAQVIADCYRAEYEEIFGMMPVLSTREGATAVFVNIGKAIAAYERHNAAVFNEAPSDRLLVMSPGAGSSNIDGISSSGGGRSAGS